MTVQLIEMFGISLLLTILTELAVTFLLGIRSGKKLLLVVLVNVLTNPPAVLFHWLGSIYLQGLPDIWLQIAIEIIVAATEAFVYRSFTGKKQMEIQNPVQISIAANLCSWIIGLFVGSF